jgi:hypothetical protein
MQRSHAHCPPTLAQGPLVWPARDESVAELSCTLRSPKTYWDTTHESTLHTLGGSASWMRATRPSPMTPGRLLRLCPVQQGPKQSGRDPARGRWTGWSPRGGPAHQELAPSQAGLRFLCGTPVFEGQLLPNSSRASGISCSGRLQLCRTLRLRRLVPIIHLFVALARLLDPHGTVRSWIDL